MSVAILILLPIMLLSAITPASFVYTALVVLHSLGWSSIPKIFGTKTGLQRILLGYALVEVTFYLWYRRRKRWSQRPSSNSPLTTPEDRVFLFRRCLADLTAAMEPGMTEFPLPRKAHDAEYSAADFFRTWFLNAKLSDIHRGNIEEWMLWALFNMDYVDVEQQDKEMQRAIFLELQKYCNEIEVLLGVELPDGYNPRIKSMRLNKDVVHMKHRPALWYLIVAGLDAYTQILLRSLGFMHFVPRKDIVTYVFPPSFSHLRRFTKESDLALSYWYRPPLTATSTAKPIILIHGIGTGLQPYDVLIKMLSKHDAPIFLVELMHVSMRMVNRIPGRRETVEGIKRMLQKEGYENGVVVGHSLGTVVSTWLIHDPEPPVSHVILVDPVVFLLHLPDVAYNFVYRFPKRANEWLLWWFASREAGISYSLGRNFFWFENILFRNEIGRRTEKDIALIGHDAEWDISQSRHEGRWAEKACIVLAGKDQIAPTKAVWKYLNQGEEPNYIQPGPYQLPPGTTMAHTPNGLDVVYCPGLDHASFLLPENKEVVRFIADRAGKWATSHDHELQN
ncbi:hypothetical protein YB2330_002261 [Saitoella coloradoensis]